VTDEEKSDVADDQADERRQDAHPAAGSPIQSILLLSDDSPLEKQTVALHRRQVLFLDGITLSMDAAMLAYRRLQLGLAAHLEQHERQAPSSRALQVQIVMDAWSVVDSVNRLRVLVQGMPGLKRGPAVVSFLKDIGPIETLRNAVQHLYGEVDKIHEDGRPLWGSLSWVRPPAPDTKEGSISWFVPGTLAVTNDLPPVTLAGKSIEYPVGYIQLRAAGETVCLSDAMASVQRFAGRFERAAASAFSVVPEGATNFYATFVLPVD
jgi:hypothetical protein